MNVDELVRFVDEHLIVEISGSLFEYAPTLASLINRLSGNGSRVHVLLYSSFKYVDVYEFYHELEPYIESSRATVFWEDSIESIIYHVSLLERVESGYLVVVLPYARDQVSQLENTYMYKLRRALVESVSRGWRVLVLNPVKSDALHKQYYTTLANRTMHVSAI